MLVQEYYLRCKDKAEKSIDVLRHIELHVKITNKIMKNYSPVYQYYSPTIV